MKIILFILGFGNKKIKKIQEKKERYYHALVIMNKMIEYESSYKYGQHLRSIDSPNKLPQVDESSYKYDSHRQHLGMIDIPNRPPQVDEHDVSHHTESGKKAPKGLATKDKKDTPLLVAAKMGILEMVKKIISIFPVAIQDQDSKGKNVVMLAAEHRQASVFDYLMDINLPEYMFNQVDNEGNSILHLAAMRAESLPWRVPRAVVQMHWEIKWYKHVKTSVPPLRIAQHNANGETPKEIFTRTHKKLMYAANGWLIKISDSCLVVTALIATVAFTTYVAVPGGLNQNTGRPILKDDKAFDIFSITSLVALCLSVTALIIFLAIITSKFDEVDSRSYLPRKLLMGLSYLFASIAAMITSFCVGHTFILRETLRLAAVPIYVIAIIPLAFFAIAQLPLY